MANYHLSVTGIFSPKALKIITSYIYISNFTVQIEQTKIHFCGPTIHESSCIAATNFTLLTMDTHVVYSSRPGQVLNLMRNLQRLIPQHAWKFY